MELKKIGTVKQRHYRNIRYSLQSQKDVFKAKGLAAEAGVGEQTINKVRACGNRVCCVGVETLERLVAALKGRKAYLVAPDDFEPPTQESSHE